MKQSLPGAGNLAFVEQLYAEYRRNPAAVSAAWRRYFEDLGGDGEWRTGPSFPPRSIFNPAGPPAPATEAPELQDRVQRLVRAYRVRGHIVARVDPLGLPRPRPPELDLDYYRFAASDLDREFLCEQMHPGGPLPLREIVQRLQKTYCGSIGVQFMHIDDVRIRRWLQERMERTQNHLALRRETQLRILTRLTDATVFEEFIRKKFVGAKSFSLEGAESLIPLLDLAIEHAGEDGVTEIVFGMAHRGRLNVLANIIGKNPAQIFREFNDSDAELHVGSGDVKYHLGYSGDWVTATGKKVHLSLCFNPSHLEHVNAVALGRLRAKQDRLGDAARERGLVILMHGDASFAGQGVVQETLNLSQLAGYTVGGTLHVIVDNRIGFTTPPGQGRSTMYASSVGKMLGSPVLHVNGEDPEAVAQCVHLAMEFRRTFRRDVILNMYCYRRWGHNEADEPSFTQPRLYDTIAKRPNVREGYLQHLRKLEGVTEAEAATIAQQRHDRLEQLLAESQQATEPARWPYPDYWRPFAGGPEPHDDEPATKVDRQQLVALLEAQTNLPADFHLHPKLHRLLEARRSMASGERPLDWATAEALAIASLAAQGVRVRLTGQDTERGTFSQRHAVLHDVHDGHTYTPLRHLGVPQANVELVNSPLSEVGAVGFEYGYSLDSPETLVMWEAQFGDFVNAAQVMIDQFLVSAENKWCRLSGLVLLLPHGLEGQGPEHSSARLERFLELAADDNIQVVQPSTPAQYFHCLRRQALRRWRKPLIVMTPKSLLRHPQAVSSLDELATGKFERILPSPARHVRRILLCTGKIYYELPKQDDIAVLRLEQLYPLTDELLENALAPFGPSKPVVWVQEEPANMGAWPYLQRRFAGSLFGRWPLLVATRPANSSPASGSARSHKLEQQQLIREAMA